MMNTSDACMLSTSPPAEHLPDLRPQVGRGTLGYSAQCNQDLAN